MTPSLDELVKQGEGSQDAVDLGDGIFMSRNIANSYLVTTSDGDLLINTGTEFEAAEIKARFARISQGPLRMITFTQGHPDHVSGWSLFNQPGVHTIAQANHPDVREYWRHLHPFYVRRIMKLWGAFMDVETAAATLPPEPVLTDSFIDTRAFELGGRRFELYSTPGGETTDALVVWMPERRTVFIGNLMGPFFGHVPNLYTLRGDKIRSAMTFIHSLDRVIELRPETLINGHDVFRGAETIRTTMTKVRDATAYLRDRTIDGMNSGADLWTLMRDVALPPELALPQVHGKLAWIVRAIWEEHVGWFRYESTTELYHVPPTSVSSDVVDLVGGTAALTDRAAAHAEAGRPLQALHLTDIVLAHAPVDTDALAVKHQALEQLLAASGRENHSEVQWLEQEIKSATAKGDLEDR
jgi:alkyl sulfatase BDS1-like metallo-beta-lactamase superfamily hydrolase